MPVIKYPFDKSIFFIYLSQSSVFFFSCWDAFLIHYRLQPRKSLDVEK